MPKKTSKKKSSKINKKPTKNNSKKNKKSEIESTLQMIEKEINEKIDDSAKWMHERRKFLIKLLWTTIFITVLLILSHFIVSS